MNQENNKTQVSEDAKAQMLYSAKSKSVLAAYLLLIFLGAIGAHRFYLGKILSGFIMLALFALGAITSIIGIGGFVLFILAIWWVIDLILIPFLVKKQNQKLVEDLT